MSGYVVSTIYADFKLQQGIPWAQDIRLWDQATGAVVPNSTFTGTALRVRTNPTSTGSNPGTLVITLGVGTGITLQGASGTFSLALTGAQTTGLTPGEYWYNLDTTDPLTAPLRLASGRFVVEPST
jgi:hypothetical protein